MRGLVGFFAWALITFAAAGVGALASKDAPTFYNQLVQPSWAPPAWVFGPVWTGLYLLMALAVWLVWREQGARGARGALVLYVLQLAANAIWSWTFFAWHSGTWSFADIILLLSLLVATIIVFWRIRQDAAMLMLPYLAWVCFAAVLNFTLWRSNAELLS